jgi:hypothetical protein
MAAQGKRTFILDFWLASLAIGAMALLPVTGCSREVGLSDFKDLKLHARLWSDVPQAGAPRTYSFDLDFNHSDRFDTRCPVPPVDTVVKIDGVSLAEERPSERDVDALQECSGVTYKLPEKDFPPASEVDTLVLSDGETTITAEFANAFARRSVALISHPDGVLRSGDRATLELTPATDTFMAQDVTFWAGDSLEACLQEQAKSPDEGEIRAAQATGTVEGNRIQFEVPSMPFTRGCLCADMFVAKTLRCEGAVECSLDLYNFKDEDEPCVMVSVSP